MENKYSKYSGMFGYFRSLTDASTTDSTKSFALFLSAIIGALIGLCVCFIICYDVLTNGFVKTNLADAGMFLLCTGGYMAGAGVTKAIVDAKKGGNNLGSSNSSEENG